MKPAAVLLPGLLFAAAGVARAEEAGPSLTLDTKFSVYLSGFWADVNTIARADGTGGRIGTRLDLESDLGLDDHDVRFIGGMNYQFNRRHGIELSYFDLNRSAERALSADLNFQNLTFSRQTLLQTSFDTQIWRLSYQYAFVDNPRHRATLQVGFHYPRLDIRLSGGRGVNNAEAKASSPLPVLGLGYAYRFSPRWMIDLRGQVFRLQVNNISGSINNFSAVVGVAPLRTMNIFLGYNYYVMDVEITKQLWNGSSRLEYKGPWAGIAVGFGGGS